MNGIDCFFEGFKLIRKPGLRRYVIIPLIINIVVLSLVIAYGMSQYDIWLLKIGAWLPDWLQFLSGLIGFLSAIIIFTLSIYGFSIIANIIASPFNAILSEKIEDRLLGQREQAPVNPLLVLTRTVGRELSKLVYFIPRVIALLIFSLIPGVNVAAPVAWLLFGAWMMAVQYVDYAADNNQLNFSEFRNRLAEHKIQALLFGMIAYFVVAIPVLNLILIPAAVAGGTVFWVEHLQRD